MLLELPTCLDPFRAAAAGEVIKGRYAVGAMGRLAEAVFSLVDSYADVELRFGRDHRHRATLQGVVKVAAQLECQRCLQPMVYPLEARFELLLLPAGSEGEEEELETVSVGEEGLDLRSLVEDELLLSLPLVPMHAEVCQTWRDETEAETGVAEPARENPFAVLAKLKKD